MAGSIIHCLVQLGLMQLGFMQLAKDITKLDAMRKQEGLP
jgi:hypothetical protein